MSERDPLEHDLSVFAATNKVLATADPSLIVLQTWIQETPTDTVAVHF